MISEEGLKKSPDKVNAVLKATRPENQQQLRSFLGLVNYYRSFLPNLSTVLGPLNELMQGEKTWKWTKQCEQAFDEVKELMTPEQVLCHYDPHKPVKLACDASPYELGSVLSHVMDDGTDTFLSHVLDSVRTGHNALPTDDERVRPYSYIFKKLTCHQNCLMWGNRVVVPKKLRNLVLQELRGILGL